VNILSNVEIAPKLLSSGPYSITLDNTPTLFDGFSSAAVFGPLFVSDVLKQGQHTVTLTNEVNDPNKPFLDLDFVRPRPSCGY
jgi:hypothetical protein